MLTTQIFNQLQLLRLANSVAVGLLFAGATTFFGGHFSAATLCVALGWISTAAFAYGINDLNDINIDIVNHPKRPLASGMLSLQAAQTVLRRVAILALCLTLATTGPGRFWPPIALAVAVIYSTVIREWSALASNLTAAGMVTIVAISAEPHPTGYIEILLNVTIFCVIFIRELQKDLLDVHGDLARRSVSLLKRFPGIMWPVYRAVAGTALILLVLFYLSLRHNNILVVPFLGCITLLVVMIILSRSTSARFHVMAGKIIAYMLVGILFAGEVR